MGFWDAFDTTGEILKKVEHGYDKIGKSKKNYDYVVTSFLDGKIERIMSEYEHKEEVCVRNTIIFCVVIIVITIEIVVSLMF